MAEAYFNKFSKKNRAKSAGIGRHPFISAAATGVRATMKVMKEEGIKIPFKIGRAVKKEDVKNADKVIVLLDKKGRNILPKYIVNSNKTSYYDIKDSDAGLSSFISDHRRNRDRAKKIVLKLVKQFG
jgi:protein-tyrosine-phosphatase